jgi:L-ascorbate metabolism protein UlaG (beta-lactamase superfamily)
MLSVCRRAASLLVVLFFVVAVRAQGVTRFTSIQSLTNSEVQLRLNSTSSYRLEVSTDLTAWEPLLSAARQSTQHIDSGAPFRDRRFYVVQEVPGTNFLAGDHIPTADGDVIIRPVNHASFVMRWKDRMIYNDPVGTASLYSSLPRANLILVSHTHGDHFSASVLGAVRSSNDCVIIAPRAVFDQIPVASNLRAITTVLTNGQSTNVNGIHVEAVPAYNGNHPRGVGNGYVLTIGGKRFYMAGDTGDIPEMRALQNIEVAFLPMNVPFTMNVAAAASAARDFKPRVLYPYHYRNQDGTYVNTNELKRLIGREHGIEVRSRAWY